MFLDKSDNEKVNEYKDKLRHSLQAGDINRLREIIDEVENNGDILELLKQELNYSKQRIEIMLLKDQSGA